MASIAPLAATPRQVTYEKEMKGLDLVRRDWCPMSKDAGTFAVDQVS